MFAGSKRMSATFDWWHVTAAFRPLQCRQVSGNISEAIGGLPRRISSRRRPSDAPEGPAVDPAWPGRRPILAAAGSMHVSPREDVQASRPARRRHDHRDGLHGFSIQAITALLIADHRVEGIQVSLLTAPRLRCLVDYVQGGTRLLLL